MTSSIWMQISAASAVVGVAAPVEHPSSAAPSAALMVTAVVALMFCAGHAMNRWSWKLHWRQAALVGAHLTLGPMLGHSWWLAVALECGMMGIWAWLHWQEAAALYQKIRRSGLTRWVEQTRREATKQSTGLLLCTAAMEAAFWVLPPTWSPQRAGITVFWLRLSPTSLLLAVLALAVALFFTVVEGGSTSATEAKREPLHEPLTPPISPLHLSAEECDPDSDGED